MMADSRLARLGAWLWVIARNSSSVLTHFAAGPDISARAWMLSDFPTDERVCQPDVDIDNLVISVSVDRLQEAIGPIVHVPNYDPHPVDGMKLVHGGPPYIHMDAGEGGATARLLVGLLFSAGIRVFAPDETKGPSPVLVTAPRTITVHLLVACLNVLRVSTLRYTCFAMKASVASMLPVLSLSHDQCLGEVDLALSHYICGEPLAAPGILLASWPDDVNTVTFGTHITYSVRVETFRMW
jgi:hypothetical protein